MKLRQKLAAVLASAMIVTAVPVVTMAATTVSFDGISAVVDQTIGYTVKDDVVSNVTTKTAIRVDFSRDYNEYDEAFIVTATDAKFNEKAIDAVEAFTVDGLTVELKYLSETSIRVNVTGEFDGTSKQGFDLPVVLKVTGNNPTLEIAANGKVSAHTIKLTNAEISKKALKVSIPTEDHNVISVEGEGTLNTITLTETVANELYDNGATVVVELDNSELEMVKGSVQVKGTQGLAGTTLTEKDGIKVTVSNDGDKATIVIPAGKFDGAGLAGGVEISGIEVVAADRKSDVSTGEVTGTVKVNDSDDIKVSGVLAEVKEFDITLKVTEAKKLTSGGDSAEVEVIIKEAAAGSVDARRDVYLTIEGGEIVSVVEGDNVTDATPNEDKDGKIEDVELKLNQNSSAKAKEYKVKLKVKANAATAGDVTIKASSRAFDEDLSVVVATATPVATIETKALTLETGVKAQKGGEIVITETDKATLKAGKTVVIDFADLADEKVKIEDATVEATGMKVTSKTSGSQIIITIDRVSKEAGSIKVTDIKASVPGYVSEGGYDVKVGGTAIATDNTTSGKDAAKDAITLKDFVVVGELNGAVEATIDLTTGAATLNGKTVELAGTPYVSAAGRTMVGVRDLTTFLGLPGDAIEFANGMVTIFNGKEIVQVSNGSNMLNKNGVMVTMDEVVTIKDGRTYAPIRFIANALGMDVNVVDGKAVFTK